MKWDRPYLENFKSEIKYRIFIFDNLPKFMKTETLKTIYFSLVHSLFHNRKQLFWPAAFLAFVCTKTIFLINISILSINCQMTWIPSIYKKEQVYEKA